MNRYQISEKSAVSEGHVDHQGLRRLKEVHLCAEAERRQCFTSYLDGPQSNWYENEVVCDQWGAVCHANMAPQRAWPSYTATFCTNRLPYPLY
jgi:hypothetical protein